MTREEIEARLEAIPLPQRPLRTHDVQYTEAKIGVWRVRRLGEDSFDAARHGCPWILGRTLTMSEAARLIEAFQ